jgi:hypothetical protein
MSFKQTGPVSPEENAGESMDKKKKSGQTKNNTDSRKFGKFYEDGDSARRDNVKLDRAHTGSAVEKEGIDTELYQKAKRVIENYEKKENPDQSDKIPLADTQTKIIQNALQYGKGDGKSVLRDLRNEFEEEYGEGHEKVDKIKAWETGMKSVCEYINQRREELSESEIVDDFELSFQVEWDAKAGVDVIERIKLTEEALKKARQDSPYLLNLVQIKSSDGDKKGPEGYAEDHKTEVAMNLKKRAREKNKLLANIMEDRPELLADTNSLNKFKFSEIKESELLQDVFSNVTRALIAGLAESAQREVFTRDSAREVIWKSFTSLFDGTKSEFKHFCALVASDIVDPAELLEEGLSSIPDIKGMLKQIAEEGGESDSIVFEKAKERLGKVRSVLREEVDRVKNMYGDFVKYYVVSRYHVNRQGETKEKQLEYAGEPMTVEALQIDEAGMGELYKEYADQFKY